jgi:hypothetical protein
MLEEHKRTGTIRYSPNSVEGRRSALILAVVNSIRGNLMLEIIDAVKKEGILLPEPTNLNKETRE